MKRKARPQRRGNVVVLSAFLMIVMMALAAFAVDVGYIAEARTQLQRSADATALAAAGQLPSLSKATIVATSCANQNKTTITPALKTSDIYFGYWDRDTATFHTPKPVGRPSNAVRVTLRRTAANGNPLGLFFGRVLGKNTTDVTASAIGFGDRSLCGPFIGIDALSICGNATTDSYNTFDGDYDAATARHHGGLCSDGPIEVCGDAIVKGDIRAGQDETVTIDGSSMDVTGDVGNRVTELDLASVDATAASTTNNNSSLPPYLPLLGGLDGAGDFHVQSGVLYHLSQGTYYFHNLTLHSGSELKITGKTTIYVTGDVNFQSGSTINNSTHLAKNLFINMTGPCGAQLNSGTPFYGVVYAPNSDVTCTNGAEVYGAIVGKTLTITGNATGHYDESLDVNLGAYALRVMLVD